MDGLCVVHGALVWHVTLSSPEGVSKARAAMLAILGTYEPRGCLFKERPSRGAEGLRP